MHARRSDAPFRDGGGQAHVGSEHGLVSRPVSSVAPRGTTGGGMARTQDPTCGSATRGSEDAARRRQGCLDCQRTCLRRHESATGGVMTVTEVAGRRMAAEIDGDFVVFLIGARFNNKLEFARSLIDLGGRRGMRHMLEYLVAHPEKGLLAYEMGLPTIVQYWRSFEHLEAFARAKEDPNLEE